MATADTFNGIYRTEPAQVSLCGRIVRDLLSDKYVKLRTTTGFIKRSWTKNDVWFRRYRTTDGYSIYGGRADLKFVDGQTNRVVAQREMEVLDVMTANRDKRIWQRA